MAARRRCRSIGMFFRVWTKRRADRVAVYLVRNVQGSSDSGYEVWPHPDVG
jgi:hypothetical protein